MCFFLTALCEKSCQQIVVAFLLWQIGLISNVKMHFFQFATWMLCENPNWIQNWVQSYRIKVTMPSVCSTITDFCLRSNLTLIGKSLIGIEWNQSPDTNINLFSIRDNSGVWNISIFSLFITLSYMKKRDTVLSNRNPRCYGRF